MPGGSFSHGRISGNIYFLLRSLLDGAENEAVNGEVRVWVPNLNQGVYPDVMVVKGKAVLNKSRTDEILNPSLIVEVLSPSTSGYDFDEKFKIYRAIPSFCEYLLVKQFRPYIERFWKESDQKWSFDEVSGVDSTLKLKHFSAELPMAEIYQRIEFED